MSVALVAVGTVGSAALAATTSPLQAAATTYTMPGVFWVVGIGAATAMFGVLLSQIVGISRMMFAMARRHDLPAALEHVSKGAAVPDYGIILTGLIISILAIVGTLQFIISAAAFTILIYYGIANICALRLSHESKLYPKWVAVVGLIFCIAMAASLPLITIVSGLSILGIGFIWRVVLRRVALK
jgi:APA family basic amino acid/polyamine antiporter